MAVTSKDKMTPETNSLIQRICTQVVKDMKGNNTNLSSGGKDLSKVKCYKCNELGHYEIKCPKGATSGNNGSGGTPTPEKWKTTPPRANEPHSKTVNSKEFHWCGKCRGTHGTTAHTKDFKKGSNAAAPQQAEANVFETKVPRGLYCQYSDPECFVFEANCDVVSSIYWSYFLSTIFNTTYIFLILEFYGKILYTVCIVGLAWCEREILEYVFLFSRLSTPHTSKHRYKPKHKRCRRQLFQDLPLELSPKRWNLSTGLIISMTSLILLSMFYRT
jgi:hypothetical protein